MSDFQEGFFRDLWYDVLLHESSSVLYNYFREEKRQQILVKVSKSMYEQTVVYGPECIPLNLLKETSEYKKAEVRKAQAGENKNSSRRTSGEHACTEILCKYYDFLTEYHSLCRNQDSPEILQCIIAFLEELYQKTEAAKVSRRKKQPVFEEIANAEKQNILDCAETLVQQVMDLYLYAEAAQFLYNAGYPLPQDVESDKYTGITLKPRKLKQARIKMIPIRLLDYYFSGRDFSFDKLSSISRMSPSWILANEDLKEKLEEVYSFACDNNLETAVIPLLIDNDSGSGLYILGKIYLQSWSNDNREQKKVEKILGGRSCCYAIVKFLNMELTHNGKYVWAPYSTIDMAYGKCSMNPEGILFNDLETALNIYNGQLSVSSADILYENFQNENTVVLGEDAVYIDSEFRKYFKIMEDEDDEELLEEIALEYQQLPDNKFFRE